MTPAHTTIRPLFHQVLVRRLSRDEETTTGGLVLPGRNITDANRAEVVAVGHRVTALSPGDIIPFDKRSGAFYQHKLGPDEYYFVTEHDVAYAYIYA